jgi:hypothetical protein
VKTETSRIEQHIKEVFSSLACLWWMERLNLNEMGMAQMASGPARLTSQQPAGHAYYLLRVNPYKSYNHTTKEATLAPKHFIFTSGPIQVRLDLLTDLILK